MSESLKLLGIPAGRQCFRDEISTFGGTKFQPFLGGRYLDPLAQQKAPVFQAGAGVAG